MKYQRHPRPLFLTVLVVGVAVVFLPPLAGIAMLALQVLGDSSYNLSRFALSDYPRAAMALLVSGSLVGYLYGMVPALITSAVLAGVILSGKALTFGWIALAIITGGVLGFAIMSLIIGGITSLTLMVTSLLTASLLWFGLKRYLRSGGQDAS